MCCQTHYSIQWVYMLPAVKLLLSEHFLSVTLHLMHSLFAAAYLGNLTITVYGRQAAVYLKMVKPMAQLLVMLQSL
jgi:hypothetical protein